MSVEEDNKKLEEELNTLMKEKVEKLKADKAEFERQESDKRIKAEKEQEFQANKDRLIKELSLEPKTGINVEGTTKVPKNEMQSFRKKYFEHNKIKPVEYGGESHLLGYEFTTSNSGCEDDVSDWTPSENFADMVWQSMYCKGFLLGKVTVRGIDIDKGKGCIVNIRTIGKRTAQGPLTPCECLSCVTDTFGEYHVILDTYGDLDEICEKDLFCAGDVVKSNILEAMSSGLAEAADAEIYNQLITASGATTISSGTLDCDGLQSGSCCTTPGSKLYNALVLLQATMRQNGYSPNYIIMSPSVAALLKMAQGAYRYGLDLNVSDGKVKSVSGIEVIEYCGALSCSEASIYAVMIDSSRAVGEAWGKRPTFEEDRDIDCDSTTVAVHLYVGIDELDVNAIGFVIP